MTERSQVTTTSGSFGGLIDALDAIISEGVVVAGDVVITLDGIDLIKLDLRLLLAGVQGAAPVSSGAA